MKKLIELRQQKRPEKPDAIPAGKKADSENRSHER